MEQFEKDPFIIAEEFQVDFGQNIKRFIKQHSLHSVQTVFPTLERETGNMTIVIDDIQTTHSLYRAFKEEHYFLHKFGEAVKIQRNSLPIQLRPCFSKEMTNYS